MAGAQHTHLCQGSRAWEKFAGIALGRGRAADSERAVGEAGGRRPVGIRRRLARGLHASVLPWLRSRDVSLLGVTPSPTCNPPASRGSTGRSQLTQVNMGLPIADNVYLEDAAREAERLKRWEFMFTLHIYQIQGRTASPFNGRDFLIGRSSVNRGVPCRGTPRAESICKTRPTPGGRTRSSAARPDRPIDAEDRDLDLSPALTVSAMTTRFGIFEALDSGRAGDAHAPRHLAVHPLPRSRPRRRSAPLLALAVSKLPIWPAW